MLVGKFVYSFVEKCDNISWNKLGIFLLENK